MGPHSAPLPAHPVAGKTRCFGRPSRGAPSLAAQSWGASSPTFLSEHPGVRAGSSCAARRRLSRFPRTVGLSALRAALGGGCAHAPVPGRLALALGLLRAPSRGSGRPASHGGRAPSRIRERARSPLRSPVRPPVPPFRVGGAVVVGGWCRRRLQARGAQWAGKARPFFARAPPGSGRRGFEIIPHQRNL